MKRYIWNNTIVIRLSGESPERFLNICKNRNIELCDIKYSHLCNDDERINVAILEASMHCRDFKRLHDICKITKCKVKIIKKTGPYFLMFKYRNRRALIAGFLLSCSIISACSCFIWNVDFNGNCYITDYTLSRYLWEKGVYVGSRADILDCEQLEKDIRTDFDNVNWVSVALKGNSVRVDIKEDDGYAFAEEKYENGCDIIASADGVIASIITRNGTPVVKAGDEVKAGQVLISGVVEILNDSKEVIDKKIVCADADIDIKTTASYSDSLDKVYEIKEFTGKKNNYIVLCLGGKCFEIGVALHKFENSDVVMQIEFPSVDDEFYFPFALGNKRVCEYIIKKSAYDSDGAKKVLEEHFNRYIEELAENKVQLLVNNVKMYEDEKSFCYRGDISINGQFTERQQINECD